jgi:hypothetical protein
VALERITTMTLTIKIPSRKENPEAWCYAGNAVLAALVYGITLWATSNPAAESRLADFFLAMSFGVGAYSAFGAVFHFLVTKPVRVSRERP